MRVFAIAVILVGIFFSLLRSSECFFGGFDFDDMLSGFGHKQSADESFYELFGLTRDTFDESTLKKAYRSLLKKYHPDHNDEPDAADKFGEITHAYEVLSDPEKRNIYNQHGAEGVKMNASGDHQHHSGFPFDIGSTREPQKGPRIIVEIPLTLEEIYTGVEKILSFSRHTPCKNCKGSGAHSPSDIIKCSKCHGSGQQVITQVIGPFIQQMQTKCSECSGSGKQIQRLCMACRGFKVFKDTTPLHVQIPGGVVDGHIITLEGLGDSGSDGRYLPGDIQCRIKELPHRIFRRGKKNPSTLSMDLSISLRESLLGWSTNITGISGNSLTIENPNSLTPPGFVMEISNGGLPRGLGALAKKGSLFVSILVKYPSKLGDNEKEAIKDQNLFNYTLVKPEPVLVKDRAMYPIHDDL